MRRCPLERLEIGFGEGPATIKNLRINVARGIFDQETCECCEWPVRVHEFDVDSQTKNGLVSNSSGYRSAAVTPGSCMRRDAGCQQALQIPSRPRLELSGDAGHRISRQKRCRIQNPTGHNENRNALWAHCWWRKIIALYLESASPNRISLCPHSIILIKYS